MKVHNKVNNPQVQIFLYTLPQCSNKLQKHDLEKQGWYMSKYSYHYTAINALEE
jgi:hypothetical protein